MTSSSFLLLLLLTPTALACPFAHLLKGHQFSHDSLLAVQKSLPLAQPHTNTKRALNESAVVGEFVLTTRLKTQASQVFNQGFPIGWAVNGVETAEILLTAGKTYKFTVQSTCSHPFYLTTDPRGQGRAPLDTGFDLPAPANATLKVCDGRSVLFRPPVALVGQDIYYQCLNHDNMGWKVTVRNQTVCDKYTEALVATVKNSNGLVSMVVEAVFDKILAPTSSVLEYFTGVVPANSTDFTARANAAKFQALRASFISFMGGALGCGDGSIPPYAGASMKEVHKNMPIGAFEYDFFVDAIVSVLRSAGVAAEDLTAVADLLNSGPVRGDVCNFENCIPTSLCDKYSGPDLTTVPNSNEVLMQALTDASFARIAADAQLKGFFDGTIPTPSVNYLGDATALAALKRRFVAFLGRRDVLICPQSNFPQTNFTIPNLRTLHANMPITTDAFNRFNDHIIAAAAALNVTVDDRATIRALLNSTEPLICNQRGCSTVPNDIDTIFDVSVAAKPSFHAFFGRGFPSAFRVDGAFPQGLRLTVGKLYAFRNTQSCTHPLYISFGTGAGSAEVTSGVENPGQLFCGGRLLLFRPTAALVDKVMFASCRNHELMSFRVCVVVDGAATPCSFATPLTVSPCDEAVNAVKAKLAGMAQLATLDTAKEVLTTVVTDLFRAGAVLAPAPLVKYFNGSVPAGSTDYVGNSTNAARLVDGLVRWFGTKLTCTDNSIDIYDNGEIEPNMKIVHSRMGISKTEFDIFNDALTALLQDIGGTGAGLSLATAARVRIFLDSTSTDICATCSGYKLPSICEKWATLANVKQETLIKGAVVAVFTKLVAANATARPLFTGEVPCESRDFVNNTANQQQLVRSLTAFFGSPGVLGCNDATFPPYTGRTDMEAVHKNMPITKAMFDLFLSSLADYVTVNLKATVGVTFDGDLAQVAALFATPGVAKICNQPGCPQRGAYEPVLICGGTSAPTTTTTTTATTTVTTTTTGTTTSTASTTSGGATTSTTTGGVTTVTTVDGTTTTTTSTTTGAGDSTTSAGDTTTTAVGDTTSATTAGDTTAGASTTDGGDETTQVITAASTAQLSAALAAAATISAVLFN